MPKHLIDTPRETQDTRLGRFLQILRNQAPHQSTRKLVTRLRARNDQRLTAYARIARGRQA